MIRKIITPILFLFVAFAFAQTPENLERRFDSIYYDTATRVAGQDVNKAFKIADSLYQYKTSDLQGVRVLMLKSSLYSQTGDPVQAIIIAIDAKDLATKIKNIEWQARILGFLSTQFRNMHLYDKARTYLEEGIEVGKQLTNENTRNIFLGLVSQEWAYYNIAAKEFEKAQEWIVLAQKHFEALPENGQRDHFIGTNYYLCGRAHLYNSENAIAAEKYKEAISLLQVKMGDSELLTGFIYGELGEAYLGLDEFDKAKEYLDKSEYIADLSESVILKMQTYRALSEYYKTIEDYKNHSVYQEKLIVTTDTFNKLQKEAIDKMIVHLDTDILNLSKNQIALIVMLISLIVLGGGLFYYYTQRKKKIAKRFEEIIRQLKEDGQITRSAGIPIVSDIRSDSPRIESDNNESSKKTINISEKKEKEIIEGLNEFEKTNGFIDRNISLATLAGNINTNTIYLSHILNNTYKKDFNLYINELRINYAMLKLTKDKKYRTYKISYLAEEFGFSSHSKFSSVFKAITGLTPSVFIDHLEKEDQKQKA